MPGNGYVMADGIKMPVIGVTLQGGKIFLHFRARGPLPACDGMKALTVYGEDGIGAFQGYCEVTWREVAPDEELRLHIGLTMKNCYGDAEEP
jgi:hypothetical protein